MAARFLILLFQASACAGADASATWLRNASDSAGEASSPSHDVGESVADDDVGESVADALAVADSAAAVGRAALDALDALSGVSAEPGPVNGSNSSSPESMWISADEVVYFLGSPDVLNAVALGLGVVAILVGERLPRALGVVASLSFGLWLGLMVREHQLAHDHMLGIQMDQAAWWIPLIVAGVGGTGAAALVIFAWKIALSLLTAALMAMIALGICRVMGLTPEQVAAASAQTLAAYRTVGAVVLVAALLVASQLARRFHKHMIAFTSAYLGTLLFLSGTSHFVQRLGGDEAPFSLLDDMARIFAEVRKGRCQPWQEDSGLSAEESLAADCNCEEECAAEITAWLVSSAVVFLGRIALLRFRERMRRKRRRAASEAQTAPLTNHQQPAPQSIGNGTGEDSPEEADS